MKVRSAEVLRAELVLILESTLRGLEAAHAAAREGATHDEVKPENDKDTRALEQSYLARGQAQRIEALRDGLTAVKAMRLSEGAAVRLGTWVDVDDEGVARRYYLAPDGGGTRLTGDVQVITPVSPLGRALLGKRSGEELELSLGGRVRSLSILSVG